MGKSYVFKENEIVETPPLELKHDAAFCLKDDCAICGKASPNRFDPYEALDVIRKFTVAGLEHGYTLNDDDLHTIEGQVEALRAYITGKEK